MEGRITGGNADGTVIATLPLGYRPGMIEDFNAQATANGSCELDINPDGTIRAYGGKSAISFLSLFAVFYAED